ncbi:NAD(+) diphosphatase [Pseudovibrio sp. Tun.PSC04-5.I4]|uniref:NAD(+) diphosphatase n=1 Tax=Pseudovibrio sp. Tun.PSC04-5.I4 TaxID=1798213 RepID=UPI00087F2F9A|nr:NAD(+) diphosphatase [Pseudovibrio sp. Tun.PSC04-5.I4]SDR24031.1 NAD+ diphosphatase [Pseudovibrio sp. Tun.PSC04-5.I4]
MQAETTEAFDASSALCYSANTLNRCGEKRKDTEWVKSLKAASETRFLIQANDSFIFNIEQEIDPVQHTAEVLGTLGIKDATTIFLGLDEEDSDRPYFGVRYSTDAETLEEELEKRGPFAAYGLRGIAMKRAASSKVFGMMAQAAAVGRWHLSHKMCSQCGKPTELAEAGYRRDCPSCSAQHFPRTDPAVIMLITHGDKCLMGRPYHLAENVYTTLAGFVEPGETLEDAVRREVFEEAGVKVGKVTYIASQPWPFPSNIMAGFHGEALTTDLNIDYEEMEDCQWFTKEETLRMLQGEAESGLICPPDISIAHHLIKIFTEGK